MKKFDWKKVLNDEEQKQVLALQKENEARQSVYHKLDLGFTEGEKGYATHLLYWRENELSGYGWATSFDPSELELTLILSDAKEDLPAVMTEIERYASEQSVTSIMLIADQTDEEFAKQFKSTAIEKQFSEYYMLLDMNKAKPEADKGIQLVSPTVTDLPMLEQLLGGSPLEEDLANTFVYKDSGQLLACIRLEEANGNWGIFGFVVLEDQRGKGLGRKVLTAAIQLILESKPESIYLEVETDNQPAYHLYQSIGFDVRNQYDYYNLNKK